LAAEGLGHCKARAARGPTKQELQCGEHEELRMAERQKKGRVCGSKSVLTEQDVYKCSQEQPLLGKLRSWVKAGGDWEMSEARGRTAVGGSHSWLVTAD